MKQIETLTVNRTCAFGDVTFKDGTVYYESALVPGYYYSSTYDPSKPMAPLGVDMDGSGGMIRDWGLFTKGQIPINETPEYPFILKEMERKETLIQATTSYIEGIKEEITKLQEIIK